MSGVTAHFQVEGGRLLWRGDGETVENGLYDDDNVRHHAGSLLRVGNPDLLVAPVVEVSARTRRADGTDELRRSEA